MLSTYLFFNGNCEQAIKLYEKVFGGKIVMMMRNADAPSEARMPNTPDNMVMHVRLDIGNMMLLASDCPPNMYDKPQGFRVMFGVEKAAEGERVFNALAEGGSVQMPYQKTFWAHRFGMVTDKFGTPWMINCEKEA
jgi:PhnB protein